MKLNTRMCWTQITNLMEHPSSISPPGLVNNTGYESELISFGLLYHDEPQSAGVYPRLLTYRLG